jgi:hypothetical protein
VSGWKTGVKRERERERGKRKRAENWVRHAGSNKVMKYVSDELCREEVINATTGDQKNFKKEKRFEKCEARIHEQLFLFGLYAVYCTYVPSNMASLPLSAAPGPEGRTGKVT